MDVSFTCRYHVSRRHCGCDKTAHSSLGLLQIKPLQTMAVDMYYHNRSIMQTATRIPKIKPHALLSCIPNPTNTPSGRMETLFRSLASGGWHKKNCSPPWHQASGHIQEYRPPYRLLQKVAAGRGDVWTSKVQSEPCYTHSTSVQCRACP